MEGPASTARPGSPVSAAHSASPESATDLPLVAIAQPLDSRGLAADDQALSGIQPAPGAQPGRALALPMPLAAGVRDGARAILQTRLGKCAVEVTVDAAVPAGAVQVGGSPGIQDVCGHAARAKVVCA